MKQHDSLPIHTDVTLNVDELTSLISCIQIIPAEARDIIENTFDAKLEGIRSKLAEAVKGSIEFYGKHIEPLNKEDVYTQ